MHWPTILFFITAIIFLKIEKYIEVIVQIAESSVHPRLSIFEAQEEFDRRWCRYFEECVHASRETCACVAEIPLCAYSDLSLVLLVAALQVLKYFLIIDIVHFLDDSWDLAWKSSNYSSNYTIHYVDSYDRTIKYLTERN